MFAVMNSIFLNVELFKEEDEAIDYMEKMAKEDKDYNLWECFELTKIAEGQMVPTMVSSYKQPSYYKGNENG